VDASGILGNGFVASDGYFDTICDLSTRHDDDALGTTYSVMTIDQAAPARDPERRRLPEE